MAIPRILLGSIIDYPTVYDESFMFSCKPYHALNTSAPTYPFQYTLVTILNDTKQQTHIHFETAEKCQQRGSSVLEACFKVDVGIGRNKVFNFWFSHNCNFSVHVSHGDHTATISPTDRVSNHALSVLFPHLKPALEEDCVIL
jgi:hypothetical protein